MKKIKFMLVALLVVFGVSSVVSAALEKDDTIEYGNYEYLVTKMPTTNTPGELTMLRIVEGQEEAIVDADGNLDFPGNFTFTSGTKSYDFIVTKMASDVYHDRNYTVKHAVIPKELTEIPTAAFNTLTNLYDLTFEAGSQVTKIGAQAFASTQIKSFDFSPCVKLEGLMDGVFVQTTTGVNNTNGNITTITLPTSTAFKHINGAFRNLTALTTINNLENSWIRELVDGAFSGCKKLTTLSLPGNDLLYISSKALEGSAIEDLSINVGTGVTNGNPMKLLGGCTIDYFYDDENQEYVYNYEGAKYTDGIEAQNDLIAEQNDLIREQARTENPDITDEELAALLIPEVEGVEWLEPGDADYVAATTNIYGLSEPTEAAPAVAPLKKLTIAGTLKGKICTNVFAWCSKIKSNDEVADFVVDELEFGTKGQIQEFAFRSCTGIEKLTLRDLGDNRLAEDEYTIGHNAFWGCPIATLTLGDINTANAIGSAAFGTSLKTVTIGSVKAADAAFWDGKTSNGDVEMQTVADAKAALGETDVLNNDAHKLASFVWADTDGATLSLAAPTGSLSNDTPDGDANIVPTLTFDMSAISIYTSPKLNPTIEIGEIASEGGVFATGAFNGVAIEKITFKGDIATDGLENAILTNEPILTANLTYVQENDEFEFDDPLPTGVTVKDAEAENLAAGDYVESTTAGKYWKVKSVDNSVTPRKVVYESHDLVITTLPQGATAKDPLEAAEGDYVQVGGGYKQVDVDGVGRPTPDWNHNLKYLVFEGKIKSSGIGAGAFNNFTNLEKITFGGLMSKEAVEAYAFTNTGKTDEKGYIGSKGKKDDKADQEKKAFVVYTANLTDNDASENPFANGAFGTVDDARIIYWFVKDEKLSASILAAIQKDVQGADYDGQTVNPKFNVYKWVAYLDEEIKLHGFVVYPDVRSIDLDETKHLNLAWGRYHLGSFNDGMWVYNDRTEEFEYVANEVQEGPDADNLYEASDMIITRFQNNDKEGEELQAIGLTTGNPYNVKVTLYGVYYDEDPFALQSSVYMVPLQVIDGQYQIPEENTHLIIVKVENLDGNFDESDKQVLINYDAPEPAPVDATDGDDEEDFLSGNSVWEQLEDETEGNGPSATDPQRVFKKAAFSWTNQELVDAVANEGGEQNIGVSTIKDDDTLLKDLYAMLNPAANAGFDIKRFVIERKNDGTGAYIGKGWYYTLLKNYYDELKAKQAARIIWLDDAEATAIFGVKGVDVKESLRARDNAIYNLQGVRVSKPGKGVYIQDGKKFIVK